MKYISTDYLKTQNVYLGDIVAVRQTMKKNDSVDRMKNGRHNNAMVYFCSDGAHYILPDGTSIEPKAGDSLYIPAGSKYKLEIKGNECKLRSIFFRLLDEDSEQLFFFDRIMRIYSYNTQLSELINECVSIYNSAVGNGLLLRSYMYNALHEFVSCVEKEKVPSPVDAALSYINRNLNTVISVKQLALHCAMSESTFRRVFKKSVGQSPLKYINSERMKKAALVLKESDLSVATISDLLGFYDEAYFIKMFKKTYTLSPSEYRKIKTNKIT